MRDETGLSGHILVQEAEGRQAREVCGDAFAVDEPDIASDRVVETVRFRGSIRMRRAARVDHENAGGVEARRPVSRIGVGEVMTWDRACLACHLRRKRGGQDTGRLIDPRHVGRDRGNISESDAARVKAISDGVPGNTYERGIFRGLQGKPHTELVSIESLLLDGYLDPAVAHDGRRSLVAQVDAEMKPAHGAAPY